jgi:hypothetical protein
MPCDDLGQIPGRDKIIEPHLYDQPSDQVESRVRH